LCDKNTIRLTIKPAEGIEAATTRLQGSAPTLQVPENTDTYERGLSTPSLSPSNSLHSKAHDDDLQAVIDAWPELPEPIKAAIKALIQSHLQGESL
jgi:hypothetical protein